MGVAADAIYIFIHEGEKFADTIQQKTDGLLLERKVFRELYSIQEQNDLPPWPFLLMTRFTGDDVPAFALLHAGIVHFSAIEHQLSDGRSCNNLCQTVLKRRNEQLKTI